MSPTPNRADTEVDTLLDLLSAEPAVQSNCMFQLALMLARIAVEPGVDSYKDDTAQAILALIRAKPKSNVIRLFGATAAGGGAIVDVGSSLKPGPSRERSPVISR